MKSIWQWLCVCDMPRFAPFSLMVVVIFLLAVAVNLRSDLDDSRALTGRAIEQLEWAMAMIKEYKEIAGQLVDIIRARPDLQIYLPRSVPPVTVGSGYFGPWVLGDTLCPIRIDGHYFDVDSGYWRPDPGEWGSSVIYLLGPSVFAPKELGVGVD